MADQKTALTPCEAAFKEWLDENFGIVSRQRHATFWQAFRAGWYARQGNNRVDSGKQTA